LTPVVRIASIGSMKMMIFNPQVSLLELARDYPPDFSGEKIRGLPEEGLKEVENFAEQFYWCGSDCINVFEVAGRIVRYLEPPYKEFSWGEFLEKGSKIRENIELLSRNPGYYFDLEKKKPSMSFIRFDGKLYVDNDGLHRTCIARFLFYYHGITHLHGVELREYEVNKYTYRLFLQLKNYIRDNKLIHLEVLPLRRKLKRIDGPGWMREYFHVGIRVIDRRADRELELGEESIFEFLCDLVGKKKSGVLRWIGF